MASESGEEGGEHVVRAREQPSVGLSVRAWPDYAPGARAFTGRLASRPRVSVTKS